MYMNGVGFEILARTPVPKLPLSYPPPPTRRPPPRGLITTAEFCFCFCFYFFVFVCLFVVVFFVVVVLLLFFCLFLERK